MAKDKHQKTSRHAGNSGHKIARATAFKASKKSAGKSAGTHIRQSTKRSIPKRMQKRQQNQRATIPIGVYDKILLVGEGDFSFAASLVVDHGVSDILATSFDSAEEVRRKYPSTASDNISAITSAFDSAEDGLDANDGSVAVAAAVATPVRYSVDATLLDKHKHIRARAPFTRIIFNFPHTGGISTDVNRQVRANQALLSSFFHACAPLLSTDPLDADMTQYGDTASASASASASEGPLTHSSSILVTLFEGEPYTLWNIRDLARSADLVVERSFRFPAESYPLYRHARTAGVIRRGGEQGEQESQSAWRGECRPARTYEFRLKNAATIAAISPSSRRRKKVKPGEESSSDDE